MTGHNPSEGVERKSATDIVDRLVYQSFAHEAAGPIITEAFPNTVPIMRAAAAEITRLRELLRISPAMEGDAEWLRNYAESVLDGSVMGVREAKRLKAIANRIESTLPPSEGWQDIETAPFETRILLWCEDNRDHPKANAVVFGRVVDFGDGERKVYGEGMTGAWLFTHWMPLPPSPKGMP